MNQGLCFLIPYYNHPQKITTLVEILSDYGYPIFIIDDGSDSSSKEVLRGLNSPWVKVFTREKNGGKGAAVKTGFEIAGKKGFSHCFQIDADMQHDLSAIPLFLQEWKKHPKSLICGNPKYDKDAPKARLYGRKITNFWVYLNTLGGDLKDVMCGMRIYPLTNLHLAIQKTQSVRMDFDIEILLYAYYEGLQFVWIDVRVQYGSVSHFRSLSDNLVISKVHAKHFLGLPYRYLFGKQRAEEWWNHQEKGNTIWLKLALKCVVYLPAWFLRFLIVIVSTFYFIFSKKERKNLVQFHQNLKSYYPQDRFDLHPYQHFYQFAESICDKFAVWKHKITMQDLVFANKQEMDQDLMRGHIILVSHFGNIEITRAMEQRGKKSKMNILIHSQNAKQFNEIINQISGVQFGVFEVGNLGIEEMLKLKGCIERGESIGIMGDRVSFGAFQARNIQMHFLGKECFFPSGAFLLAGLLECPISMLWCEKREGKYWVSYEPLAERIILQRDKQVSIKPYLQCYISSLENKIRHNPTQWFNFFDIWEQGKC